MAQVATTSIFNSAENLSTKEQLIMKSNNYEMYQNAYNLYMQKKNSTWFEKDLTTNTRKETMYLARKNAYDSLRHSFDLNRSFIENKTEDKIKSRLENKIKNDKHTRAMNHKHNNKEKKELDRRTVQFAKASDLYMEGSITKDQFNEMIKKYKL